MKKGKDLRINLRRLIKNWAVPVGCGLVFLFLLKFVFFFGYVPTASMEPTINADTFIFGVRVIDDLSIGDIVVFEYEGNLLVKRIAALPGDEVEVDGKVLTVLEDHYYMLGDNADSSIDSRYWEFPFLNRKRIIAKLLLM